MRERKREIGVGVPRYGGMSNGVRGQECRPAAAVVQERQNNVDPADATPAPAASESASSDSEWCMVSICNVAVKFAPNATFSSSAELESACHERLTHSISTFIV